MRAEIIGREEELKILSRLLTSKDPELLAIYGRRRVGKTYLIRGFFDSNILFACSGQQGATTRQQLINFQEQLNKYFPKNTVTRNPQNWTEAFSHLRNSLDKKNKGKKVLFFDEVPWLDTHKSGFLSAFGYFWNIFAAQREDLIVVICGSAASWMIKKVVNNKGALHNRITKRIRLLPFNLKDTRQYLEHRNIRFDNYQLLQLYMVMGGVPHYLNAIERGKSVMQNIENICFSKDGLLEGEFNNLYAALFNSPEKHIQIIQALAKKSKGLTRNELLTAGDLFTGGSLSSALSELIESGFVEKIFPYNKKNKDSLYRLADEFSLFYFRFMQGAKVQEKGQWIAKSNTASYKSWCGYAFENICLKHIYQLKKALGITGVYTEHSSWHKSGDVQNDGTQIDLLIDRYDRTINICEIKFSPAPYTIDKKYAVSIRRKKEIFQDQPATNKTILLTFISTFGITDNNYKQQLVDSEITMDDLFI